MKWWGRYRDMFPKNRIKRSISGGPPKRSKAKIRNWVVDAWSTFYFGLILIGSHALPMTHVAAKKRRPKPKLKLKVVFKSVLLSFSFSKRSFSKRLKAYFFWNVLFQGALLRSTLFQSQSGSFPKHILSSLHF